MKQTPVFIIDGSSFLYRAYYSIRPLTTKEGVPVNAVYGFCRMIKKLIDTQDPSHMVIVWDSKGKTERHELYPAYKETRQAPPNDLFQQKDLIQEFAETIGVEQLAVPAIEADDLMYSVAMELEKQGHDSILVSSDKDLGQMLGAHITMLDPFKEEQITREALEAKLGFSLDKLPFYYALVGDSSDNIPGVTGIGPKGATKLVVQFDSLDHLYNSLEDVSSERTRSLLLASKEKAFLSQELFTLRFHEVDASLERLRFTKESWKEAYPLFQAYQFESFLKDVAQQELPQQKVLPALDELYTFVCVTNVKQLQQVADELKAAGHCALDTETTSLDPVGGELVGISLCMREGTAYYIPCGHSTQEEQVSKEEVITVLGPLLKDTAIKKYLHHAKFDRAVLQHAGIELQGVAFDTLLAASLVEETGQRRGLKDLSQRYFHERMFTFEEMVKNKGLKNFGQVPLADATVYAAADAHQTMKLVEPLKKALQEKGMTELFDLEMACMGILSSMERRGICVDCDVLADINKKLSSEIDLIETKIHAVLGDQETALNLNSPKQVGELLFERLGLPIVKKTAKKTGYSTDQEVLDTLAKVHPVPGMISTYRELYKLKSTYVEALTKAIEPISNAIHTTYSQTAVATGRLASSDPNLQNIPVKQFGIRSSFKPRPGHLFVSADYSQIELRILAYVSQDETLKHAFDTGKDIHALTASGLFSVPVQEVTSEQRQVGKRINFSILYGLTAHGLSKDLGVTYKVAQSYIDGYMAQYPGVVRWMEQVVAATKEKGYVQTVFGRQRYLPGIYERNRTLYDLAKRVAINTIPQGTASELMKKGMVAVDKELRARSLPAHMLLQIHDELLIEVPKEHLDEVMQLVKGELEHVVSWDVPLEVTVRSGADWQEVTK